MRHHSLFFLGFFIFFWTFSFVPRAFSHQWQKKQKNQWESIEKEAQSKKYSKAIQNLESKPLNHSSYYYNLGTLYCQKGQWAMGLGYLEKAAQMDPLDTEIQYQIRVIEAHLKIPPFHLSFVDRLSLNEVRVFMGVLGILLLTSWGRTLLKSESLKCMLYHPANLIVFIAFLMSVGLYYFQRWGAQYPLAIQLHSETLRSGPGLEFTELFSLQEGARVRLLKSSADWYQVRDLISQKLGWIQKSTLFRITEPEGELDP